jgi:hypothetical protein
MERGGAPRRPTDDFERGLTLIICLSAIVIEGIIIGQIVELVAELSSSDETFREKVTLCSSSKKFPTSEIRQNRWMSSIYLCEIVIYLNNSRDEFDNIIIIFGVEWEAWMIKKYLVTLWGSE